MRKTIDNLKKLFPEIQSVMSYSKRGTLRYDLYLRPGYKFQRPTGMAMYGHHIRAASKVGTLWDTLKNKDNKIVFCHCPKCSVDIAKAVMYGKSLDYVDAWNNNRKSS